MSDVVSVYHGVLQLPASVRRYSGKAILPPTAPELMRCTGLICRDFLDEFGIPRGVYGNGWIHHVEMVDRDALVGFPEHEAELESSGLDRDDVVGVSFADLLRNYHGISEGWNVRHIASIGQMVGDLSQRDMVLMIQAAASHGNIENAIYAAVETSREHAAADTAASL